MAIYHLRHTAISRQRTVDAGTQKEKVIQQSAIESACYRFGGRLTDARTGKRYDYRHKKGIVESWLVGWNKSRSALWNKAEAAEKRERATVAREITASLPHELNEEQRKDIALAFSLFLSDTFRVAVDTSYHCPERIRKDRPENAHVHFLYSTRRVTKSPTKGEAWTLGEKTREWDRRLTKGDIAAGLSDFSTDDEGVPLFGRGCVELCRKTWEEMANRALAASGSKERIDRRSYRERGIDKEPINRSRATIEIEERDGRLTPQGEEMKARETRNKWRRAKAATTKGRRLVDIARTPDEAEDVQLLADTKDDEPERQRRRDLAETREILRRRMAATHPPLANLSRPHNPYVTPAPVKPSKQETRPMRR